MEAIDTVNDDIIHVRVLSIDNRAFNLRINRNLKVLNGLKEPLQVESGM